MAGALGNVNWGGILGALGAGLQAAGSPSNQRSGILANYQDQLYRQQMNQRYQQEMAFRTSELAREQERQRREDEAAAQQMQAQQAAIANLPPELQGYAQADPSLIGDYAQSLLPKKPGQAEWKTIREGDQDVTYQINPDGTKVEIGRGRAWAPQQAKETETWEPYVDEKSGRTGQRNRMTGKIDWDPGQSGSVLAQVGTDANGQPIFDFVSQGPKLTEAQTKAANQYTLMTGALDDTEKLLTPKEGEKVPGPWTMATAETMSGAGPIGRTAAQQWVLGPEEKKYIASRAAALESLASSITGAAFTEEQKQNFISMLPQPTDDKDTTEFKFKRMRNYLKQLERNAGPALALPAEQQPTQTEDNDPLGIRP